MLSNCEMNSLQSLVHPGDINCLHKSNLKWQIKSAFTTEKSTHEDEPFSPLAQVREMFLKSYVPSPNCYLKTTTYQL